MGIGAGGAAAIAAGAQIAGSATSAYAQGRLNRKTRKWNEKMHDLVRSEALADWHMQNEYNSPQAQMQRYRDAGLNPNLIYGQSNEGPTVRSSEVQGWSPRAPEFNFDARPALSAYYDVQLKEASLENLRAQNTIYVQEALLKAAQTADIGVRKARNEFDLFLASDLRETSLEAAKASLRKVNIESDMALANNERQTLLAANTLKQGIESILTSRLNRSKTEDERRNLQQSLRLAKQDEKLKDLDIELKKQGVQPGDNLIFRIAARYLDDILNLRTNAERENRLEQMEKKRTGTGHSRQSDSLLRHGKYDSNYFRPK